MNYAAKTEWTEDEALERFHEDMSNSCDYGDRKLSTEWLAKRLGNADRAEQFYEDWMAQQRQAVYEYRRAYGLR